MDQKLALIAAVSLAVAGPAATHPWTACVDPETGSLSAEGFTAIREAARFRDASSPWGIYRVVRANRVGDGSAPLTPLRLVQIELMYAGVGPGSIRFDEALPYEGLPLAETECFTISREQGGPGLWHYWGVYFGHGETQIPSSQRPALEYVMPGYIPGRTRFIVDGHADTVGTVEQSQAISEARTDAVVRELLRLGARWMDIEKRSWGETRLARPTPDETPEGLNRRVTVDVRVRTELPR